MRSGFSLIGNYGNFRKNEIVIIDCKNILQKEEKNGLIKMDDCYKYNE